jgi:hypothetical protein
MDPQQRRAFLKRSTTALVGVSLANSSRLLSGETKEIRVGVITEPTGTHMSAYFKSLGICSGIQQVALAGTSGQNFEKAKELLGARGRDARTFSDYREM